MTSPIDPACVAGPPGWILTPEGAAVHPGERAAVIADVHLGYEWARAAGGDVIPPHSLAETIARLTTLLDRAAVSRLIVAGDLVETPRPCPRTSRDVLGLATWLRGRGVSLDWVRGNHDPSRGQPTEVVVAGWTIRHGDRGVGDGRAIFGHHHPALRAAGLSAPCFLVGETTIALPAFSPNAAGLNIAGALPRVFAREPLRCVAGMGEELLDFGPLEALVGKLRGA